MSYFLTVNISQIEALPGLPGARKCSKIRGEVCKAVAPRPIRDSPPAVAAIFPSP